jgi:hypothetical protein
MGGPVEAGAEGLLAPLGGSSEDPAVVAAPTQVEEMH